MKTINIKLVLAAALLTVFAGCKDSDFDSYKIQSVDSHGNGGFVISTAVTAAGGTEAYANAVDASTDEVEYQMIPVVLNATEVASQDIHVTMVPDPESLAAYNPPTFDDVDPVTGVVTPRPDLYWVMAGSPGSPAFTLVDNGVVTIPKGSSVGYLKIKTTSANYFGSSIYAYSFKISSVQEPGFVISGNHYWGIVALIPKNPWDGHFKVTGTMADNAASTITAATPFTADLVTTGLTTNGTFFYTTAFNDARHPIVSGGSLSVYGEFSPVFTFDSNDNIIAVKNSYGQPSPTRVRAAQLDPTGVNKYDRASGVMKVKYIMTQAGAPRTTFDEVWTYSRPR